MTFLGGDDCNASLAMVMRARVAAADAPATRYRSRLVVDGFSKPFSITPIARYDMWKRKRSLST